MTETPNPPNRPEDLVALAEGRLKEQREREESQQEERLIEARATLRSALSDEAWNALGIDPASAQARDSGVVAGGSFSYAGEEWNCEAYSGSAGRQRDGVQLTVELGDGFVLREKLKSPYYPGDASTYQSDNAAAVGSFLAALPTQKALASEKRAAKEKERLDKALSKAAYAFNGTYSASYLRDNLARADEFRAEIQEGTAQRKRLEEMISDAQKAASKKEAEAAGREKRVAELLEKVKNIAGDQLEAQDTYDERCRRYAKEQAEEHFFAWTAQEIRYCPALTAEAISALRSSAAYYGGSSAAGDEYAGAYDAVSGALVQQIVALNVRAAADHEPGAYLFDRLGYDGTRTPLVIGALLDATELSFPEHDATESMAYHRSVPVGRFYVNVPGAQVGSKAIAGRIADGVPETPTPFDERLVEAGISDEDLELLPYEERNAVRRNAYRFLAGATDYFDPHYDPDIPF